MNKKKQDKTPVSRLARHFKLEKRRLLNADFNFTGGVLELTNFVDSDAGVPNEIRFEQTSADSYDITISEGVFGNGPDTAEVTGLGTNTLSLDNSLNTITSILSRSTTADSFDIQFGDFAFAGDLTFESDGVDGVNFGSLTQDTDSSIDHGGALTITAVDNITLDQDNDFTTVDLQNSVTSSFNDTNQFDADSFQSSGDATVTADGPITLNNAQIGGALTATTSTGDINVDAMGDLTLQSAQALDGSVTVAATDNIQVLEITAESGIFVGAGADGTGSLTLDGNVTTDSAGQTLLQSADGVTQASGSITTNDLLLGGDGMAEGNGDFVLSGDNAVNQLSANITDSLTFSNSEDLELAALTSSVPGTSEAFTGVDIEGDLDLSVDGDLTQSRNRRG